MVRAFKSTLEDIEDRRSSASVPSLRSGRGYASRPYSYVDIPYVDDTRIPSSPNDLPYESYLSRQPTLPELPENTETFVRAVNEHESLRPSPAPERVPLLNANGSKSPLNH